MKAHFKMAAVFKMAAKVNKGIIIYKFEHFQKCWMSTDSQVFKFFNEILVPLLEQMDNNQKIGLNFQTADAILPQNNTYLPHNPICQI